MVSNRPAFCKRITNNIWPLLLEKAWAKINGSYEDTISGSSSEALKFLVLYPVNYIKTCNSTEKTESIWDEIENASYFEYMVTCSTNDSDDSTEKTKDDESGIVLNHCYSITGNYEVKTPPGKLEKLLKISNPWNKQEYKGKWSDLDDSWTSDLKTEVDYDSKLPGEFYVDFETF